MPVFKVFNDWLTFVVFCPLNLIVTEVKYMDSKAFEQFMHCSNIHEKEK